MTLLHAHFHLRNVQAFQRALDSITNASSHGSGGFTSTSGGKSSLKSSQLAIGAELNSRDWLGRTVLHLSAAVADGSEYTRLLLRHQQVNVNLQDSESGWTALHRALYNGNISAVVMLLQRSDIDTSVKDLEGYTAFDLYNSTVEGTKPDFDNFHIGGLYTWGANRNAALGVGNGDDRAFPDQVTIHPKEPIPHNTPIPSRFAPIQIREIQMSKLHTVIVTSEKSANLRLCGFGGGGRLGGPVQHTQYDLKPLPQLPELTIVAVAVGQDHTLALSEAGEVYSWGLNRFSQLGYLIEKEPGKESFGRKDEPIQSVPRKVQGGLKKEFVIGVAASKSASASWTETELFTWGTNGGQLGYDKVAQPVQIFPRKVTKISRPVLSVALSDSAMACLLDSQDVICIWNDWSTKISFPATSFPSGIQQPYRPPQAVKAARIAKVTCSDDTFAALSSSGELFTFNAPTSSDSDAGKAIRPQPVWALRKQWSRVRDVAVGAEGSIIISTESGHVFVRSRTNRAAGASTSKTNGAGSAKAFKFQRVPYIQRVLRVCANATGAYGALKSEYHPRPIVIEGNTLAQDMHSVRPFVNEKVLADDGVQAMVPLEDEEDDDAVKRDVATLRALCHTLLSHKGETPEELDDMGADMVVRVTKGNKVLRAHRAVILARSAILMSHSQTILGAATKRISLDSGSPGVKVHLSPGAIEVAGCHPLTVLVLLNYMYTDELLAVWDRRVAATLDPLFTSIRANAAVVKSELMALADILDLNVVSVALQAVSKRGTPPTLVRDITHLFISMSTVALKPDVVLAFKDRNIPCFSVVLRARSVLFRYLFGEKEWAQKRFKDGRIEINMKHMRWHVMEYVVRFLCCGEDIEVLRTLDFAESVDETLEFLFEVIAAANELHLDRLILICASIILDFTTISNVCYILTEATHFHVVPLMERVHEYMAINLETLLERKILDVLEPRLIKEFGLFVIGMQTEKLPHRVSTMQVDLSSHADWLALQDIPEPFVPSATRSSIRTTPRKKSILQLTPAKSKTPTTKSDDIFLMDMDETVETVQAPVSPPVWRASSTPRVDMRAVMASEAAHVAKTPTPTATRLLPRKSSDVFDSPRPSQPLPQSPTMTTGGPWKLSSPATPTRALPSVATPTKQSTRLPPATPPRPALGPVITPTRQPQASGSNNSPRRPSQPTKAWSAPTPIAPAPVASTRGMSFVAIQQLELDHGGSSSSSSKDKRSLLQIQEEEESKRQEDEFLRWWQAEEDRVRLESQSQTQAASKPNPKRRGGKPKKKAAPAKAKE